MSDNATPGGNGPWQPLDVQERRVLGVLVEKAKTTQDAYPLSLNALVTGSNQKSNRDPILDLEDDDVAETLDRLKVRGMIAKVIGGRVERYRHLLYETWMVDKVELAILGELLLRGPQTEGELRTRASRMEPIDDLDALRRQLKPLVERNLVVYLTAEDRRGAMLTHGFHEPGELSRLKARAASAASAPAPAPVAAPRVEERSGAADTLRQELAAAMARIAALEHKVSDGQAQLAALRDEFRAFRQSLGG